MEFSKVDYYKFASAYSQLSREYEFSEDFKHAFINKKMEVISLLKCGIMSGLMCYRGEEESQLNCETPEVLVKAYMQSCAVVCKRYNKDLLDEFAKIEGWDYNPEDYALMHQLTLDLRDVRTLPVEVEEDYGATHKHNIFTEDAILNYVADKTSPYIKSALKDNPHGDIFTILEKIGADDKHKGKNRLDVLLGGRK